MQEGVTCTLDDDGNVVCTRLVTDNPDGLTLMEARSLYAGSSAACRMGFFRRRRLRIPGTGGKISKSLPASGGEDSIQE